MGIQTVRARPSRRLPPRGRLDLPERIRYLLTDRRGRGIGRGLGFPIAMTCRVSINASCKRICLKWVKLRRTQCEQMSSGFLLKADVAERQCLVRKVPKHEVAALQPAARGARVERSVSSREDVSQHRLSNATLHSHSAGSARSRGEVRGDVPAK